MKKFFICAAVVAAAAFGVMKTNDIINNNKSTLKLENIEALANCEPGQADCDKVCTGRGGWYCIIACSSNYSVTYTCLDYIPYYVQ